MESPFSAIKRGFDNTVANWPLLLIRIAENVVMVALIVGGILAVAIPIGLSGAFLDEIMIEDPEELLNALLGTALLPVLLAFLGLTLILVVVVAVHSFVQAGIVGVYVDGERQAPRAADTHRSRFKAFTPERWLEYGRRDWWPVFLIYNLIWGVWGLIVLLPLLAVAAALWLARDQPEAMLAVGCGGLVLVALLMIVTGFVVHLWSTVAIVLRSSGTPTTISIHEGWRVTVRRAVPLISIAVIAIVVSFAAASAIGMGAFGLGIISSIPGIGMLTIPMQIGVSFLQTAVSLVVSAWFLAAVVSVILSP